MKALVPDASVVAKLLFEEEGSDRAEAALSGPGTALLAPDLLLAEVAGVIWKRARRGELTEQQARESLERLLALPVELAPTRDLVADALDLALATDRTVYDCLYLALAIASDAKLLTADERLVNALRPTTAAQHVQWLKDPA